MLLALSAAKCGAHSHAVHIEAPYQILTEFSVCSTVTVVAIMRRRHTYPTA
ncbi:Uncharacterised protein [Mycobacteroides abscessus subsp. abscessus]|nr:Uncharacterised protein [Mycobacteroides abscessus subsp. abscessus]